MDPPAPDHRPSHQTPEPTAFAVLRGPVPPGTFWIESTWSQQLPAPVDRVWALVSNPARRPEFDHSTAHVAVDPDGGHHLIGANGHVRIQRVIELVPGQAISWRRHRVASVTPALLAHEQVEQLVLHGDTTSTLVQAHCASPGQGAAVRLSRPLLQRMMQTKLRHMVQALGQSS